MSSKRPSGMLSERKLCKDEDKLKYLSLSDYEIGTLLSQMLAFRVPYWEEMWLCSVHT